MVFFRQTRFFLSDTPQPHNDCYSSVTKTQSYFPNHMKMLILPLLCLCSFASAVETPVNDSVGGDENLITTTALAPVSLGTARNITMRFVVTESAPSLAARDSEGRVIPGAAPTYSNEYSTTSNNSTTSVWELGSKTTKMRFSNRQFLESLVELGFITEITGWSIVMVTPATPEPVPYYSYVGQMYLVRKGFTPRDISSMLYVFYDNNNGDYSKFSDGRVTMRSTYASDTRAAANVSVNGRWVYTAQSIVVLDVRDENNQGYSASLNSAPVDVIHVPQVATEWLRSSALFFANRIDFTDSRGLGAVFESQNIQPVNDVAPLDYNNAISSRFLLSGRLMTGSGTQVSLADYPGLDLWD